MPERRYHGEVEEARPGDVDAGDLQFQFQRDLELLGDVARLHAGGLGQHHRHGGAGLRVSDRAASRPQSNAVSGTCTTGRRAPSLSGRVLKCIHCRNPGDQTAKSEVASRPRVIAPSQRPVDTSCASCQFRRRVNRRRCWAEARTDPSCRQHNRRRGRGGAHGRRRRPSARSGAVLEAAGEGSAHHALGLAHRAWPTWRNGARRNDLSAVSSRAVRSRRRSPTRRTAGWHRDRWARGGRGAGGAIPRDHVGDHHRYHPS